MESFYNSSLKYAVQLFHISLLHILWLEKQKQKEETTGKDKTLCMDNNICPCSHLDSVNDAAPLLSNTGLEGR